MAFRAAFRRTSEASSSCRLISSLSHAERADRGQRRYQGLEGAEDGSRRQSAHRPRSVAVHVGPGDPYQDGRSIIEVPLVQLGYRGAEKDISDGDGVAG